MALINFKSSSNLNGDFNEETNFPHKLLLTNREVSRLSIVFTNNLPAKMNCQKLNCQRKLNCNQNDFLVDF